MPKLVDLPPLWLAGFCLLAWAGRGLPEFAWPSWVEYGGFAAIALALGLMVWAVVEMARARTTPIPHQMPTALVRSGPFRLSRNPIYLGDAIFLVGFSMVVSSLIGLALVPGFVLLITRRFILAEEARLERAFGAAFAQYAAATRRWL